MYTSSATNFLKKIKLKTELSYDLDISHLIIYPNESKSAKHTATCTFVFVTILRITKLRVNSICPSEHK